MLKYLFINLCCLIALNGALMEPSRADAPAHHTALQTFRDCPFCPTMAILPAGHFTMGSPMSEPSRSSQEGPQHQVTIGKPFALGVYATTYAEYAAFVRATNRVSGPDCIIYLDGKPQHVTGTDWRSPGFDQTARHPAVCLDLQDAHAYVQWLNDTVALKHGDRTGQAGPYRLPNEVEWEYAARAGTETAYSWGDDPNSVCSHANEADVSLKRAFPTLNGADCNDGFATTSPVGSFAPNPFGLYDMAGNVFQWIEDCYHPNYEDAPVNDAAWTTPVCAEHVIRGGSSGHLPRLLRSAYRFKDPADHRSIFLGLRVARDLD